MGLLDLKYGWIRETFELCDVRISREIVLEEPDENGEWKLATLSLSECSAERRNRRRGRQLLASLAFHICGPSPRARGRLRHRSRPRRIPSAHPTRPQAPPCAALGGGRPPSPAGHDGRHPARGCTACTARPTESLACERLPVSARRSSRPCGLTRGGFLR